MKKFLSMVAVLFCLMVILAMPVLLGGCSEDLLRYKFISVTLTEAASTDAIQNETVFTIEDFAEQIDLVSISQHEWQGTIHFAMELRFPNEKNRANAINALLARADVYSAYPMPQTLPITTTLNWPILAILVFASVVVCAGLAYQIHRGYPKN